MTAEGWFRATGGDFVTTEPVGTEAWMPLNNFPTAKPTYDFYDTIAIGKTAIANGDPRVADPARSRRRVPGRVGHVALAFAGSDRQLPRRGERR